MRSRHRHALAALLAVPLALATATGAAAQIPAPQEASDHSLHAGTYDYAGTNAALDRELTNVGVESVLRDANREADTSCGTPKHAVNHLCFQRGEGDANDQDTANWYPQGVTTVSDAVDDERWGSAKPVLTSWYNKTGEKGARVSFLDPTTRKYRHVLLAIPSGDPGAPNFRAATAQDGTSLHAGGLAWYGHNLYVPDTAGGIRVFSTDHILDLAASDKGVVDDADHIGADPEVPGPTRFYSAYGYRYVMLQSAYYVADKTFGSNCGAGPPRYSFISVDRSTRPDRLITGEYCKQEDDSTPGRAFTWDLAGGRIEADSDGRYRPEEEHQLPVRRVQGVAAHAGSWYMTSSNGKSGADAEFSLTRATTSGANEELRPGASIRTSPHPEDLSYFRSSGTLWTLGEQPGDRAVYSVRPPR